MSGPKDKIPPDAAFPQGADEDWDATLGDLSRAYRGIPSDEPSPSLDDAIRAAARRAVHSRPQSVRKSWVQRWSGPVATAAVVVLTVSVGILTMEEKPDLISPPRPEAKRSSAPSSADKREETLAAAAPSSVVSEQVEWKVDRLSGDRPDQATSAKEMARPEAPRAIQKKAAPPPIAREPVPFVADMETARELVGERQAAAPALADSAQSQMKFKADSIEGSAGASAAASPPSSELRAKASRRAEVAPTAIVESLEAWLKRILILRKEGKAKEFEAELAKFKERYPDYSLPLELKDVSAPLKKSDEQEK
ncbi:MAG TPA: hypothetical protein VM532_05070 [Burkholderiales bacterium]|nr:hypothetical protein [Burkholderiales bacterium]